MSAVRRESQNGLGSTANISFVTLHRPHGRLGCIARRFGAALRRAHSIIKFILVSVSTGPTYFERSCPR